MYPSFMRRRIVGGWTGRLLLLPEILRQTDPLERKHQFSIDIRYSAVTSSEKKFSYTSPVRAFQWA